METKFKICDEVFWMNTGNWTINSGIIGGIQIVPISVSKDAEGRDVLDGSEVLYKLNSGQILTEKEVFSSRDALVAHIRDLGGRL